MTKGHFFDMIVLFQIQEVFVKKAQKDFLTLMAHLDPFPTHNAQRRYDVWMNELSKLEQAIQLNVYTGEEAKACGGGGRRGHVEARIKHIKAKLAEPAMRAVASRERRVTFS